MEEEGKPKATEQDLVRACLVEILRLNGYENMSVLTLRDYEHISQEIETKTTTLISVSTLKRLLHGEFSRIPQTATLNAISNYLGHKNWQEYKSSSRATHGNDLIHPDHQSQLRRTPKKEIHLSKRFKVIAFALGSLAIMLAILFIRFAPGNTVGNFDKASFSAQKTTSNEIPNTVIFHYDIDDVDADSFFIQQSWDEKRRVRIFKNSHTLTDIYYEPGYHVAKLIANDSIIKTIDISIPTDRWFLFAKDPTLPSAAPEYISPTLPIIRNGVLRLDNADLKLNKINVDVEKNYIYSFYPSTLQVNSDNYILKAKVKVNEVRNNFCHSLMIEVLSQQSFMYFRSHSKGCSSESVVQFGDTYISGKQHDLSLMGSDFTDWLTVEMKVENRKATIFFNGSQVFATSYNYPLGLITGIAIVSNGLPEIDFIELKGLDGTVVYQNDFTQAE